MEEGVKTGGRVGGLCTPCLGRDKVVVVAAVVSLCSNLAKDLIHSFSHSESCDVSACKMNVDRQHEPRST